MKRYLCCLALLGVVAVPDWASAFHPCWCPPPPCGGFYGRPRLFYPRPLLRAAPRFPAYPVAVPAPVYGVAVAPPPVYIAPPAIVIDGPPAIPAAVARPVPAPAAQPAIVRQPTVRPAVEEKNAAVNPVADKVKPKAAIPPPILAAEPPPNPPEPESKTVPAVAKVPEPKPDSTKPKPATPAFAPEKPTTTTDPDSRVTPPLTLPPLTGPKDSNTSRPSGPSTPSATPTPAPPPTEVEPIIPPPSVPTLPEAGAPKKASGTDDALPPLVLPPEAAGASSGVVPESTSRSSPLSAGMKVQVYTATGTIRSAATRKIGFFNHTNRDIDLVIEGRSVKLPRKTYIHAEVPPTFSWGHSDNPARATTVPSDSPGLDVLFRD